MHTRFLEGVFFLACRSALQVASGLVNDSGILHILTGLLVVWSFLCVCVCVHLGRMSLMENWNAAHGWIACTKSSHVYIVYHIYLYTQYLWQTTKTSRRCAQMQEILRWRPISLELIKCTFGISVLLTLALHYIPNFKKKLKINNNNNYYNLKRADNKSKGKCPSLINGTYDCQIVHTIVRW